MNKLGNMQQVAFVTGGSGFIGGRLIEAVIAQGWQVRALVRGQKAAARVTALRAVPVFEELRDQAALSKAMAGCEVVFHVAALFKMWGKQKDFNAVNVEGTRTLVEATVGTPSVRKVIMVSAGAVVQGDPEPLVNIDERAPIQQRSFAPYSASKAEAEQILLAANGRRDVRRGARVARTQTST
jgi:nucleoside-diphosphate-sugar epimerase